MQRLISLGMLVILLGGGGMFLKNLSLGDVARVANQVKDQVKNQNPQQPYSNSPYPQRPQYQPQYSQQPQYQQRPQYQPQPQQQQPAQPRLGRPMQVPAYPNHQPNTQQPYPQQPVYAQSPPTRTVSAGRPIQNHPVSIQPQNTWGNQPSAPGRTLRIASYNIQVFGTKKASKPYVMKVLAQIIAQFDIVAIQEIRCKDQYLLNHFLQYVNQGGVRKYKYIIGPRLGRSSSKEQYAFIYNTQTVELNQRSVYTVRDPDDLLHREPLVAMFRARVSPPEQGFTFVLVNMHTDPHETDTELDTLADVYRVVKQQSNGEDDIIMLGDLNVDDLHLGRLGKIPGIFPVISGMATNTKQNKLYDHIILHRQSTTEYTGRRGVVDVQRQFNLTLEQAQMVSDHLPVWAEFNAYEPNAQQR